MIEILFGESEGGSMKAAKNYRSPNREEDGATAWFGRKPTQEEYEEMFEGEPVGGHAGQVVCLPFLMDMGKIQEAMDSGHRLEWIFQMYGRNLPGEKESLRKGIQGYKKELEKLKAYIEEGKDLRIWYSDAPYSLCGLYSIASLLKESRGRIYGIKLPGYWSFRENSLCRLQNWGEVPAGKFYQFLPLQKEMSKLELKDMARIWEKLREENASLRAVVNGRLISVTEEFYDFLLEKEIPEEEFVEARLIGKVLGTYRLSVGDWWFSKRIDQMIVEGRLAVKEPGEDIYRRILKKTEHF